MTGKLCSSRRKQVFENREWRSATKLLGTMRRKGRATDAQYTKFLRKAKQAGWSQAMITREVSLVPIAVGASRRTQRATLRKGQTTRLTTTMAAA